MINLLPPVKAEVIRYGRLNFRLRTWLIGMGAAMVGLILIIAGGSVYLAQQTKDLQSSINGTNSQLTAQNFPQVQKEADEIGGDIKLVNDVLNHEVDFAGLLQSIGKIMPPHTVLNSLTLTSAKGAVDLSASAVNNISAAQIAINLGAPENGLFDKVDIVNISCLTSPLTYKCTATLKALFSKTAQNEFLGVVKATP